MSVPVLLPARAQRATAAPAATSGEKLWHPDTAAAAAEHGAEHQNHIDEDISRRAAQLVLRTSRTSELSAAAVASLERAAAEELQHEREEWKRQVQAALGELERLRRLTLEGGQRLRELTGILRSETVDAPQLSEDSPTPNGSEARRERTPQAQQPAGESIEYAGEIALLEDQVDRLRAVLRAQQEERMRCLDLLGVVRPDESIRLPEVLRDQMSSLIGKCVKADARAEQLHASLERVRAQEGALRARVRDLEIETRELQKMELVAVGMARARAQVGAGVVANADRPTPKRGIVRVTELAPSGYVAQVQAAYGNVELVRCSHNSCPDVLTCESCLHNYREFRRELDERNAQFEAASRERERANEQLAALQVRLQERDALIDRYERGIRYLKRMNVYGASNMSGAGASGGRQLPASIQAVLRDLKQKRQKPAVGGAGAAELVDSKGTPRAPVAAAADAEVEQSARLLFVSPQDGSGAVAFPPVQQSQHDAKRAELPLIRLSTHLLKNANGNGNAESGASGSSRAEQFEATSSRSLQPVRPPKKHSRRRGAASLPPAPAVTSVSRCMRCGALYRIEDNTRLACRFHPGGRKRVEEYSSIGLKTKVRYVWECCGTDTGVLDGCCTAEHV